MSLCVFDFCIKFRDIEIIKKREKWNIVSDFCRIVEDVEN